MAENKKKPEAEKKKKPEEEEGVEIDFGIGKLGFGGLFKGIGNLIDLASKVTEAGGKISGTEEFRVKGLGDKAKGIFGFSINTLAGGETRVESFGNIKKTPEGPVVEEVREPIVDVFNEADHLLIVAELPGIDENDAHIEVKGDILTLSAERGERKYSKEVLLPSPVDATTMESLYRNGVLEIKLKKAAS